jgi:NADPH:quinone reductase-like Zn-dependent oxidoreductase
MRTFAITGFEERPGLIEVPTPQAGPGEVLVRVRASSLNGIDLAMAAGVLRG